MRATEVDVSDLTMTLHVNDEPEPRQVGHTSSFVHSIPDILAHLSRTHGLRKGDLVLTGTPAGVGLIQPGDRMTMRLFAGRSQSPQSKLLEHTHQARLSTSAYEYVAPVATAA